MNPDVPPAVVLGSLFCLGYAALLHLWLGRNGRDLWISLLMTATPLWQIGQLHLLEATVGAWLLMGVARLIGP
jgi:hypothetical protein